MSIFISSDFHISHQNIIKYSNRPFSSYEEMNEELIKRFNSRVSTSDTVYFLGDFTLGKFPTIAKYLPRFNRGRWIWVLGNHDPYFATKNPEHLQKYLDLGVDEVKMYDEIEIGGYPITLSHFPYKNPQDEHRSKLDKYKLKENRNRIICFGHTHLKEKYRNPRGTLQIHIGVDAWDYYPVSEDEILNIIEEVRG